MRRDSNSPKIPKVYVYPKTPQKYSQILYPSLNNNIIYKQEINMNKTRNYQIPERILSGHRNSFEPQDTIRPEYTHLHHQHIINQQYYTLNYPETLTNTYYQNNYIINNNINNYPNDCYQYVQNKSSINSKQNNNNIFDEFYKINNQSANYYKIKNAKLNCVNCKEYKKDFPSDNFKKRKQLDFEDYNYSKFNSFQNSDNNKKILYEYINRDDNNNKNSRSNSQNNLRWEFSGNAAMKKEKYPHDNQSKKKLRNKEKSEIISDINGYILNVNTKKEIPVRNNISLNRINVTYSPKERKFSDNLHIISNNENVAYIMNNKKNIIKDGINENITKPKNQIKKIPVRNNIQIVTKNITNNKINDEIQFDHFGLEVNQIRQNKDKEKIENSSKNNEKSENINNNILIAEYSENNNKEIENEEEENNSGEIRNEEQKSDEINQSEEIQSDGNKEMNNNAPDYEEIINSERIEKNIKNNNENEIIENNKNQSIEEVQYQNNEQVFENEDSDENIVDEYNLNNENNSQNTEEENSNEEGVINEENDEENENSDEYIENIDNINKYENNDENKIEEIDEEYESEQNLNENVNENYNENINVIYKKGNLSVNGYYNQKNNGNKHEVENKAMNIQEYNEEESEEEENKIEEVNEQDEYLEEDAVNDLENFIKNKNDNNQK